MSKEETIEDVRRYWDARPCNVRHSPKQKGTYEYFEEVAARKAKVEPHIAAFAEYDKWKGKKVLEIGCGIGTDAIQFVRAGADYTGVDLSSESLALAKERFRVYDVQGTFFCANAENISTLLAGNQYDLIYSFGVIHHTPNPKQVIAGLVDLLKPDGELRVMLYAQHSWKSAMISASLDQPEAQFGCPIANTYTHDEARTLLAPFVVTRIEQAHIFPYQIEHYKRFEYVKEPWFEAMPDNVFSALEKSMGWHLLIWARLPNQ